MAKVKYSAQATIQTYNAEIESQLGNIRKKANAYLMTNSDYEKLDEQSKTAASLLVNSINENIANEFSSNEDVGAYVGKLVASISDNKEVQDALKDLFTIDTTDMSVGDIVEQINKYINSIAIAINEDPEELKIRLGFDYVDDLEAQYQRAVDFAKDKFDGYDPTTFFKEHSINTQEEIDKWQEIAQSVNTAIDAENAYIENKNNLETSTFDITTYKEKLDDIKSSVSTLRSALDSLNSGDLSKIEVIDLMQQFPELAPYVDLTADAFGNLSEGLSELIYQQPSSLIQSLQELKKTLNTDEERTQVELLIDSLQRLSSYGDTGVEAYATTIGNTWSDTENVIEGVVNQFENLAKIQEMVADGLTMSATAAAELAKMYPEILTNAEVSANGQITLNEGVVNSILEGDSSIIDAQIAKLEADKAELTAKKSYAEAQLNMVKQVAEGEGKQHCPTPQ